MPTYSSEAIDAAAWEIAQPWPWKRSSAILPSSHPDVHAQLVAAERVVVVRLEVVRSQLAEVPRVLVVVEDVVAVEVVHGHELAEDLARAARASVDQASTSARVL